MPFEVGSELAMLLGGVVAGVLALSRLIIGQQRALVDQFVRFVETSSRHLDESQKEVASAIRALSEGTRENTTLLRHLAEQLGVRFRREESDPWP